MMSEQSTKAPSPVAWWQRVLWRLLALALVAGLGTATAQQWLPTLRAQVSGSQAAGPPPSTSVELPGVEVPTLPSPHIARLGAAHTAYNSLPPTSGPHLAWTIAPGIYSEVVPDELAVHALEHGHVVVRYAPSTPPDQVALLAQVARQYPRDVVLSPYPALTDGVALTAWGRIERLSTVDTTEVETFVRMLRGRYNHGWVPGWQPGVAPASASGSTGPVDACACVGCGDGCCRGC